MMTVRLFVFCFCPLSGKYVSPPMEGPAKSKVDEVM